jgi:hypothetical protein
MIIFLNILYSFFIVYFIFFIIFWSDFKRTKIFRGSREIFDYLCLDHRWTVFAVPSKSDVSLILSIEYYDGKKELINLFDCENMTFLSRKINAFDAKYIENIIIFLRTRTIFIYYIKNYIEEKNKNKKVKKIEFIKKIKEINLWDFNSVSKPIVSVKVSSYNF